MRHVNSGQNEDDLSRLTSSSTTTSTPTHNNNDCNSACTIIPIITKNENEFSVDITSNSNYLPQIVDPLEWQKSRKRKERQDSTSSITQDRKLVRSNSEELIPTTDCEVIRRVSSHEDFKKPVEKPTENNNVLKSSNGNVTIKRRDREDMIKTRCETSPARSHRLSPHRDYRSGKYKENDETECEHERRRSTERFSKTRATPGRKSGNAKKLAKNAYRYRERNENDYKYDIAVMKSERRGFVSKFMLDERSRKEEAADGEQINTNDLNDNNLIDSHQDDNETSNNLIYMIKPDTHVSQPLNYGNLSENETTPPVSVPPVIESNEEIVEALPWDCSIQEDQTPVLCRRFAEYDNYTSDLSSNLPLASPAVVAKEAAKAFGAFTKMENLKTRAIMQNVPPPGFFQNSDERLKQINKKLVSLKKRLAQLDETFEDNFGFRPSHSEKSTDKQTRRVLDEITRLKREKHQIKLDPMGSVTLKVVGGMDTEKRLQKMTETMTEIQKKLEDKRIEARRPQDLDTMNAEQLVQEKTAIQHGLLYFESQYGRPMTREERDITRALYDRYRVVKRLVGRSVSMSGSSIGVSELPTILEHEAMAFTADLVQSTSTTSSETVPIIEVPKHLLASPMANAESPSDNSGSQPSTDSNESSNPSGSFTNENVHKLTLDELWMSLDNTREEKKNLKRTIKEFEASFEVENGRKMLKSDRKAIEDTYAQYKQKKAKVRLLQALIKKKLSK